MNAWAACIRGNDGGGLAALRLLPGTECLEIEGAVWLRGGVSSEELEQMLTKVPGLERFELLDSARLKSPHSRIPSGLLPTGAWRPLKEVLAPELPAAALAGETRQKLPLVLVRSAAEQKPGALITTLAEWLAFASAAPNVRLQPLSFATADDSQTLVVGEPLPALRGIRLVNQSGILFPCGFAWSPTVDASVLRELFGLRPGDFAVLAEDNTLQVVQAEQFSRASRSAVRATAEGFKHE